ncbi:hypothetical protein FF38_11573 [Lucilia cuprina]|uniref:Uncharacterized protein n=1 Tax=Lucilia cuprina TaxID=7375 RepID=A0A0L0CBC2_LUCCU|nr:hypothetical protein FF38_11573 [Lucilia cuprina]
MSSAYLMDPYFGPTVSRCDGSSTSAKSLCMNRSKPMYKNCLSSSLKGKGAMVDRSQPSG